MKIVVLRLITGEEILSESLGYEGDFIKVKNPVQIVMMPARPGDPDKTPKIALAPWLQFAAKKEQLIPLHAILLEYEPVAEFVNQHKQLHGGIITPPQKLVLP
jgi:hypothetical protein